MKSCPKCNKSPNLVTLIVVNLNEPFNSKEVGNLLVAVSLSLDFAKNVYSVIISQRSRHLVVVHRQVVLLNAPQLGQPGRVDDLEHTRLLVLPRDVACVALALIVEQLLQKVPEQTTVCVQLRR